jgi:acyl-coenzyme A thioesterase PaaI-like protein
MAARLAQFVQMARQVGSELGSMTESMTRQIEERMPSGLRETAKLRVFGLLKIPILFFVSPTVTVLDGRRCVVRIPLNRRTRNHLNSMYFGVLACGADCAGGLLAMYHIDEIARGKVSLIFKDFEAKFLKRPEGDTDFTCEDGEAIAEAVRLAVETGERQNLPMKITATTPQKLGDEPVAVFVLTLSLKYQGSKSKRE